MAGYRTPTEAQVKEALRRIPTQQLRRAFFEGLRNPLWLEPLAKEGIFSNPPEPEKTTDGLIRDLYWPEIGYLIRVAPEVPAAVVDILLGLSGSTNAWVRRAGFTIGASIPADEAARLKPLLKSWLSSGFGWRTDPREMVDFAINLLTGGQYKTGVWVARVLFRPRTAKSPDKLGAVLDDYWYAGGLSRIVGALGDDGLQIVLPWLVECERAQGHLTNTFDVTYMSRESIRAASGFSRHESVEQSLINAVRDLGVRAMGQDPATGKRTLLGARMILARKIALFAVGEALVSSELVPEQSAQLVAVARVLLFDDESRNDSCRIEYGELARAVARISPTTLDPLVGFIASGPLIGIGEVRERLRRDPDETPEALEARFQTYLDGWRHRWLAAVGSEALPTALKPVLADLDSRLGVIDDPLAPVSGVTSWTGPNSPISQDEMAAMSPNELVAHLESWHDTGDGWGPEPSHEGQGRELTALITTSPKAVAGVDGLVVRLRPTYLRAILQGWEAALRAGFELAWDQVADVVKDVLAHGDESSFPVEGGDFDDDPNFRSAKQAAVSLLVELVKKRDENIVPGDALVRFADLLIDGASDETAWTEYDSYDDENSTDPLTVSINWQWPIRIRGLLNLIAHSKDAPWYDQARSAFEEELARTDRRGASRAILGEGLGRLLNVDPEWTKPRIPGFFGTVREMTVAQQIALTTAIATHYYHRGLYDLLKPSMVAAINLAGPLVTGWRGNTDSLQRIAEWAIDALIFGHETMDDPVVAALFGQVDPKVRGEAMGHVAWSFMHAETVEDSIRDRFADLWDARIAHVRSNPDDKAELSEFYWVVRSGKFDSSWWLSRFVEALELDPELAGQRYMVGKEVAAAADVDPRGALDVTKALLDGRDEAGLPAWELTRNAVPVVIARAIASGDEQLERDAVELMNRLGESGNQDLEKQVNAVLSGEVTQDDVTQ